MGRSWLQGKRNRCIFAGASDVCRRLLDTIPCSKGSCAIALAWRECCLFATGGLSGHLSRANVQANPSPDAARTICRKRQQKCRRRIPGRSALRACRQPAVRGPQSPTLAVVTTTSSVVILTTDVGRPEMSASSLGPRKARFASHLRPGRSPPASFGTLIASCPIGDESLCNFLSYRIQRRPNDETDVRSNGAVCCGLRPLLDVSARLAVACPASSECPTPLPPRLSGPAIVLAYGLADEGPRAFFRFHST